MHFRFLAAGDSIHGTSFNFLMGRATVCKIVSETCQALRDVLQPLYITCPKRADEWVKLASDFDEPWNLPHCLGAMDGKHVVVQCPPRTGSLDFNYKKEYSKLMFAVCDAKYK